MRQIVDSVAVEIELSRVVPKIANAVHAPARAREIGAAGFNRMEIARKNIFSESIVVRVRADPQADVIMGHAIARDPVRVALIEGKTDRVLANLISFERDCDRTIGKSNRRRDDRDY